MSKRFGRNQRRRLRAEIANANLATLNVEASQRRMGEYLRAANAEKCELRRLIDEFASRIGRYAIVAGVPAPYESHNLDLSQQPNFRMARPALAPTTVTYSHVKEVARVRHEVMAVLDVQEVRESASGAMHCELTFDGLPIGYAISRSALEHLTKDEFLHHIVPQIANFLGAELQRKGYLLERRDAK